MDLKCILGPYEYRHLGQWISPEIEVEVMTLASGDERITA